MFDGVTKNRTAHTARTARGALTTRVTKYRTARTASRNTAPRREIITAIMDFSRGNIEFIRYQTVLSDLT